MKAIYETKGRAREYCELAINLYTGCGHQCIYCYGATVTHQNKEQWEKQPQPRKGILNQVQMDASKPPFRGSDRQILMCFVTDPYQPLDDEYRLARKAIILLHNYGLRVTILTKAGIRAQRDFDLLVPGKDVFAVSLTLAVDDISRRWERFAALPEERIANLREAHKIGLETWVSCEPVIYPDQTLALIEATHTFVDHYKVGTLNYHPHGKTTNWYKFARDVKALLERLGKPYYLKNDLRKFLNA